jgi:signal transduction histidine kinase
MRLLSDASIKHKLEAIILATAASVLLLSFILYMALEIRSSRGEASARMQSLAVVLGANSSAAIVFSDRQAAASILETLSTQKDVMQARIVDRDGDLFAEYLSPEYAGPEELERRGGLVGMLLGPVKVEEQIVLDGQAIGTLSMVADLSRVRTVLVQQTQLILGVFVIAMLLALLLSSRLHRVISVPINRLLETMDAVASKKDFGQRAERVSNDELGNLVDGFNLMLDQVQEYDRELAEYQGDLESLVAERTRELESAKAGAEAASQAKSEFLATISHEIRTPMSGVIGFTKLLGKTHLNEQQRDYIGVITSSAHTLLDIIDDILDFSRMEAGRFSLEVGDFDLSNLLDSVRRLFTERVREKGITLTVQVAGDVPVRLHGDSVRLQQILTNLIGNAIKFTDQGQVMVRIDTVPQEDTRIGLRISVLDSGIGITSEQRERLFQPFQQGDSSITRRHGGAGLGLVITQRLAALMDGRVTVTSIPGEGSTFTAVVRLEQSGTRGRPGSKRRSDQPASDDREGVSEAAAALMLSHKAILVVDDSPVNLMLAKNLLVNAGAEVTAVESAAAAVDACRERRFGLILMDLEMPVVSGYEAARQIRASATPSADTPIVAITAHAFSGDSPGLTEAGIDDLLAKPYLPEQLYEMASRWCASGGGRGVSSREE